MKIILSSLLLTTFPLVAGELVPAQVPASAKWVLHADLDAMRASETGKTVFEQIETEHGAQLRALKRMFSFHLINDLSDVTLFGNGLPEQAAVLFNGTFDRAHIEDVLRAAENFSQTTHAGVTVLNWTDKGQQQHAAFAAPDLLVFSRQQDLLHQALDVLKSGAASSPASILPEAGSKPLIAAGANLSEIELPADSARLLRHASVLKINASEQNGRFSLQLSAETPDSPRASRLRRILDGVVALAEAGSPDLSAGGFQFDITATEKPGVSAAVSLPIADWIAIMKSEIVKKQQLDKAAKDKKNS